MHNGSVSSFTSIRRAICDELDLDTYANVLGTTDSEHVAGLYMTYLTSGRGKAAWEEEYSARDMANAMTKAVGFVIAAQTKILGQARAPNSLNLAATDGKRLVTFRFRNHSTKQPPSLYYSTTAGVSLNRKYEGGVNEASNGLKASEHGAHVIVASEPTTYNEEEWNLIGKNECVMVETSGAVVVEAIKYEQGWDAENA